MTLNDALEIAKRMKREGHDGHTIARNIDSNGFTMALDETLHVFDFPTGVLVLDHSGNSYAVEGKRLT